MKKTPHLIEEYRELTNPNCPEAAYVLGFLFADGFSDDRKVGVEIVSEDFDKIEPILFKVAKWSKYSRVRKDGTRKPQSSAIISSTVLCTFLEALDFRSKSEASPKKLLSVIPKHLHRYFWLGIIDGDGCFYINPKRNCRQFCIASSYNQDWSCAEELFQELGVKYKISKTIIQKKNGENKSSIIRIANKKYISKLFEYLYPSGFEFGLKRKYDKAFLIWKSQQDKPVTVEYEVVNGKRIFKRT